MIKFSEDAIAFSYPCFREASANRVQPGLTQKTRIAVSTRLPNRPMSGF